MQSANETYHTVVIVQKSTDKASLASQTGCAIELTILQIVACGSIFTEQKLVRGGGIVGHIEDIAVSKTMQGKQLGIRVIKALEEIGRQKGCYKIILDCGKNNIRERPLVNAKISELISYQRSMKNAG
jgi:glucosamine-phosphate N-acetyltransferase